MRQSHSSNKLDARITDWTRIMNTKRSITKVKTMRKNERVDYQESEVGELVNETFSIKVKGEDEVVLYEDKAAPFSWRKISLISELFAAEGAALDDSQISFLGQAFPSDAQGKVLVSLVDLYNSDTREKAKANAYQKLMTQYKPASEEDKAKAFERAIRSFVTAFGVTEAKAREMVLAAQAGA